MDIDNVTRSSSRGDALSADGLERRGEMLALLLVEQSRVGRRRRRRRRRVAAASCVLFVASVVTVFTLGRQRDDGSTSPRDLIAEDVSESVLPSPNPETVIAARDTTGTSPRRLVLRVEPCAEARLSAMRIGGMDSRVPRVLLAAPSREGACRVQRIADDDLLDLLAAEGFRIGLVTVDGRTRLSAEPRVLFDASRVPGDSEPEVKPGGLPGRSAASQPLLHRS